MNTRLILSLLLFTSACINADIQAARCDIKLSDDNPCDPVRQKANTTAGQCCDTQYCSYSAVTGKGVCVAKQAASSIKAGDRCSFENAGTANQTDNCGPNMVCMTTEQGGNNYRCMIRCEANRDCPNVNCSSRAGISEDFVVQVKVCDPGAYLECGTDTTQCCNPLSLDNPDQCTQGQVCRLLVPKKIESWAAQSSHSFTTCDFAKGVGSSATRPDCRGDWDCMEKNVCIEGLCRRICEVNPTTSSTPCSEANPECIPLGDNYGYCQF